MDIDTIVRPVAQSRLIAGAVGAIAGSLISDECKTWKSRTTYIVVGCTCAFYLTPMGCKWFGIVDPESIAPITFVVGALWQKFFAKIAAYIDAVQLPTFTKGGK